MRGTVDPFFDHVTSHSITPILLPAGYFLCPVKIRFFKYPPEKIFYIL
ncbi:hypothetical protein SB48_HM08orf01377 [Heyndrickxia coagulans]|uniref:Uncharacterized protein n=1 Tax=Heyndrickxia coagulans TaxID=1398 RepID=A0AAN0WAY5_HEYCO|nr:hypothetical protein SB48_HM08orf01377 [Heyndrickxia coagulans]